MEYFFNEIKMNGSCQNFLQKNIKIVEDCLMSNPPEIKPMLNINEISSLKLKIKEYFPNVLLSNSFNNPNLYFELLIWRYYCFCHKDINIIVSLKPLKINSEYKLTMPISDKQLNFIQLQINFIKMKFSDFIEYLFDKDFGNSLNQSVKQNKNKKLYVYLSKTRTNNEVFFQSSNFYETVEAAKIFLNYQNYDIFEKQSSFIFTKEFDKTIKLFFKIKFLKYYYYHNYSLLEQEYFIMGGSYLLFAIGLRTSRDIDIYSIEGPGKKLDSSLKKCGYDIHIFYKNSNNYKSWNEICINPINYYFLFGMKANNYKIEIVKRLKRYQLEEAGRPLSDLIALLYYFNEKIPTEIKIKNSQQKLKKINYMYKYINSKKILEYLNKNKKIILE